MAQEAAEVWEGYVKNVEDAGRALAACVKVWRGTNRAATEEPAWQAVMKAREVRAELILLEEDAFEKLLKSQSQTRLELEKAGNKPLDQVEIETPDEAPTADDAAAEPEPEQAPPLEGSVDVPQMAKT